MFFSLKKLSSNYLRTGNKKKKLRNITSGYKRCNELLNKLSHVVITEKKKTIRTQKKRCLSFYKALRAEIRQTMASPREDIPSS